MSSLQHGSLSSANKTKGKGLLAEFAGLARLWPYMRGHKRAIIISGLLIPVISALQVAFPMVLQRTIDRGILAKDFDALTLGALVYLGIVLAEYGVRACQSVLAAMAVHRTIKDLRTRLIAHVMELRCAFHDQTLSGTLVTRATSDFDNLSESLNMGVLTSFVDIAVLIGCIIGMVSLNPRLALIAIVLLPLVWLIVQWFSRALKSSMLAARVKIAALNGYTQEAFYGNQTIKLLTAEASAQRTYDRLNEEYRKAQMGSVVLDALMFSVLDGIASITVGLVLWYGLSRLTDTSELTAGVTAGVMVAFVQYVQQLFEPLKQLGNKMAMLQGAFTAIDRIFGLFDEQQRISGHQELPLLRGEVVFKDVSYGYDQSKSSLVLKNLSFVLPAGQSLALVGKTGSGKSTIIKLVAKLYEGYTGTINLDGRDLALIEPCALRRKIAIVPQDIVLFAGDLAFNISLGDPTITREDMLTALHELGADDFLARLGDGLDSQVLEQGQNLSQGQRQLIAFARALVRKPGLVILDEATSSVDAESEAQLKRATEKLLWGRSVIVVAHRLSTIRQCDQILVLDGGTVVERGRHDDLVKQHGAYQALHEAFAT